MNGSSGTFFFFYQYHNLFLKSLCVCCLIVVSASAYNPSFSTQYLLNTLTVPHAAMWELVQSVYGFLSNPFTVYLCLDIVASFFGEVTFTFTAFQCSLILIISNTIRHQVAVRIQMQPSNWNIWFSFCDDVEKFLSPSFNCAPLLEWVLFSWSILVKHLGNKHHLPARSIPYSFIRDTKKLLLGHKLIFIFSCI